MSSLKSTDIRFPSAPLADFFPTLRKRVGDHFSQNGISKYGNHKLFFKTALFFTFYFGTYVLIMAQVVPGWAMLLLSMALGLGMVGLGMSVMHDALHNAYSKHKVVNNLFGFTMEMLGGSSFTWKIQHNMLHHTYTNVYGMDEDIHDKVLLRLSPSGKRMFLHRFQHIYAFLLYSLSSFSWVLAKDFKQLYQYNKQGLVQQAGSNVWRELFIQVVSKSLFIFFMLILPIIWLDYAWYWVFLGFCIVLATTGFVLTVVFLTAHAVEEADHIQPDETGSMESNWAIHQLRTTANFNTNKLFSWYIGGLNYQIEHHLFPGISHVHYPQIAKIVEQTAREYGLPYYKNPSFRAAVGSHVKYLYQLGNS
jgi:linoleoyl-CoA desaturase